ncbi:protein of unknown function [Candidatus Nitrospira inopinata]|jgi:hypothetical protein|uniref:Uncharacterized protein n=1 Tax=Candidatus Nitrospira inopinata TaxID=1715989 RepID=A0A0S4KN21_9BACT|nr:protein of unknown function [Candidatus Nitrospira inopinata]
MGERSNAPPYFFSDHFNHCRSTTWGADLSYPHPNLRRFPPVQAGVWAPGRLQCVKLRKAAHNRRQGAVSHRVGDQIPPQILVEGVAKYWQVKLLEVRNTILTAFHGDWDRQGPRAYAHGNLPNGQRECCGEDDQKNTSLGWGSFNSWTRCAGIAAESDQQATLCPPWG